MTVVPPSAPTSATPLAVPSVADVERVAAALLGGPVWTEVLKDKPGRRRTARVHGQAGSVIAKAYAGDRAARVAKRVGVLADGPDRPVVPQLRAVDADLGVVLLDDVVGAPLSTSLEAGDVAAVRRAAQALAGWHTAWAGRVVALQPHTVERERRALQRQA